MIWFGFISCKKYILGSTFYGKGVKLDLLESYKLNLGSIKCNLIHNIYEERSFKETYILFDSAAKIHTMVVIIKHSVFDDFLLAKKCDIKYI